MLLHALQKRVRCLFSSRRQQSLSSSPSGQTCAAAAGASEPGDSDQGRQHHAAARGDLKRRRWYFKGLGIDPRDQQRRTSMRLASANGHADVIRHLPGENCQLNLADNLKRTSLIKAVQCQQEEHAAVLLEHGANPNLTDAGSNIALHPAILSGNNVVAVLLLEHNASSDAQNQGEYTPLNLAVSKQHEEMLECLLKRPADKHTAEQCQRTVCVVTTSHNTDVEEDNLRLHEELERVEMELREMEEKYLNSERCVQNLMAVLDTKERETTAAALKLQDQLSVYLETVKHLEEHVQHLVFEMTRLEATVQQQNNITEALQRDLEVTTTAQAASQNFIKQSRASHHDSLTSQLKHRIRRLEWELDRIKDTQQESAFQKQCTQAELEKYKELYLKEEKISKCQAKELERANERLEEANAKLLRERHKSKSLITSNIVSGGLAATPVLYSTALGHLGSSVGLDRSHSLGGSFLSQYEKILSSKRWLATSVAKVRLEQEQKIIKELKEATAKLETGCARLSKFHLDQDHLCRTIEEYHDVSTKNYLIK